MMEPVFFTPNMKHENLRVTGAGQALPPQTRIMVQVDATGTTADMVHILPGGPRGKGEVVVYDDCDVRGPMLSWFSEGTAVFGLLYQRGELLRLVGVIHSPTKNRPVEEWVAEDDGGIRPDS